MSKYAPGMDKDRLVHLSEEISRIASSLARLTKANSPTAALSGSLPEFKQDEVSEDAVKWLIRARCKRAQFLPPDLFAEPAWDILLDLLRAEIEQQRVCVSSLCIAAGVPATTALRCINGLVEQGLVARHVDRHDGRRTFVELSPDASAALRRYFVNVVQARPTN